MFANVKTEHKQTQKDTVQKQEAKKTASLPNLTGIPDNMKSRFESLSDFSFDDVRVHYNSDKPVQLQALAYTQGNQVYIAPGQEKHLGHELGHVVQQKQGRVQPTVQAHGISINDDERLEREADDITSKRQSDSAGSYSKKHLQKGASGASVQMKTDITYDYQLYDYYDWPSTARKSEYVGGTTTAILDPSDAIEGSEPTGQEDMMKALKARFRISSLGLVRGHLLNHDLGGLGVRYNMFPITARANHAHSSEIEEPIKKYLYDGNTVTYTITANNNNSALAHGKESSCSDDTFNITVNTGAKIFRSVLKSNMWNETGSISQGLTYTPVASAASFRQKQFNWYHGSRTGYTSENIRFNAKRDELRAGYGAGKKYASVI